MFLMMKHVVLEEVKTKRLNYFLFPNLRRSALSSGFNCNGHMPRNSRHTRKRKTIKKTSVRTQE